MKTYKHQVKASHAVVSIQDIPMTAMTNDARSAKFAYKLEDMGDRTISIIGNIAVSDVLEEKITMPFMEKPA